MSDELRKDEDPEVEAHMPRHSSPRHSANEEPRAEGEEDDEVEAHSLRLDSPRHSSPRHT
jgi:hypothetical protein